MKRKIIYIFSRDFNQWTNQLIKEAYATTINKLWCEGLEDQMVHFTGRTFTWYRYEDDNQKLKKFMVDSNLEKSIFHKKTHEEFMKNVDYLRLLNQVEPSNISKTKDHLREIKKTFNKLYPLYPLSIFLAGPWKKEFLKVQGKKGERIVELLMKSRHHSEGVLKENDNYMRKWLGPILEQNGLSRNYVKIMTVEEIDNLVNNGIMPRRLEIRSKGFFYINNKIIPTTNFMDLLKEKNLYLETQTTKEIKGVTIYQDGIIKGKAKIVLNSEEISKVKEGDILVTTMTAPDYLPIIMKAKAIVTDEGGLTCHAAIVAREQKKPAIMGTKNATKVLKDGDMIEVDTEKGVVRKI